MTLDIMAHSVQHRVVTADTVEDHEALGFCFKSLNGRPVSAGGAEPKGFFFVWVKNGS